MIIFLFVKNQNSVIRLFFLCYNQFLEDKLFCVSILSSSVVERSTVNRLVVGSSPTWGVLLYFYYSIWYRILLKQYKFNSCVC